MKQFLSKDFITPLLLLITVIHQILNITQNVDVKSQNI